jgi:hypothetical protein
MSASELGEEERFDAALLDTGTQFGRTDAVIGHKRPNTKVHVRSYRRRQTASI